ncbi:hypothetical protein lerEdw1_019097 [Lerista edwardsae]|nr:hypothetical protein lerEdw1_019097 [Lerista edwardsae]
MQAYRRIECTYDAANENEASVELYRYFPGFDWFITSHGLKFANDENPDGLWSSLLLPMFVNLHFLCYFLQLYNIAAQSGNFRDNKLRFILFPGELGYGHINIYQSPELPQILWEFLGKSESEHKH